MKYNYISHLQMNEKAINLSVRKIKKNEPNLTEDFSENSTTLLEGQTKLGTISNSKAMLDKLDLNKKKFFSILIH